MILDGWFRIRIDFSGFGLAFIAFFINVQLASGGLKGTSTIIGLDGFGLVFLDSDSVLFVFHWRLLVSGFFIGWINNFQAINTVFHG